MLCSERGTTSTIDVDEINILISKDCNSEQDQYGAVLVLRENVDIAGKWMASRREALVGLQEQVEIFIFLNLRSWD